MLQVIITILDQPDSERAQAGLAALADSLLLLHADPALDAALRLAHAIHQEADERHLERRSLHITTTALRQHLERLEGLQEAS
jgi:hypothetical protein